MQAGIMQWSAPSMAYDEGLAQQMREVLADRPDITEKSMFGGRAFLLNGNMVCGVHRDGGMARVGKANEARARAMPGTGPMMFTGRAMGGMVALDEDLMADPGRLGRILDLALGFAGALPPK